MLTADLVSARRRGNELHLVPLGDASRARAIAIADALGQVVRAHVGQTEEALLAALAAVPAEARDVRVRDALTKLLLDRCEWTAPTELDPEALRKELFTRASALRAALGPGERLDREAVVASVAADRSCTPEVIERTLFADLRGAQLLSRFDDEPAAATVAAYERGQAQAVLLRAVKITVDVQPGAGGVGPTRALFRRLKFLQLLHTIERRGGDDGDGYRVVIDGPFSLFESATRYGQKLARVLPALEGTLAYRLEADVRWGKEKTPLVFRIDGASSQGRVAQPPLPDEVAALLKAFGALSTTWRAKASTKILDLPGLGIIVPDLVFTRMGGEGKPVSVYLEVLGFWSRAAVWKRVELVQAGLAERTLFAVSSRLRVSEEVLGADLPGALYVYKRVMSARAVLERVDALAKRALRTGR